MERSTPQNIAEAFVEKAQKYPERTAIIEAGSGRSMSFRELNRRANGYAAYFQEHGVQPADSVMLMVKPGLDFICLTLALFKSGTPVILIDPGMGYENLLKCIRGVEPEILIGIPQALLFAKLFPGTFTTLKRTFCCGNSLSILGPDIRKKIIVDGSEFKVYSPGPDDLAAIIFTTGSTGPPKGVRYEHSIFSAQLKLIESYYGIGPQDTDQPAFPLFALFSAALGACSVIPDMDATKPAQVNPKKFVHSIEQNKVTYSFGSPAIWNVVSRYCIENRIVLKSVNKVLMAGAPVPYELLNRVRKILPEQAEIHTPYGATESLPIVSIESREIIADAWYKTSKGAGTCVGRPLPGIDIKIISISDVVIKELSEDMFLLQGEIGEIIVKGDVVTRGYVNARKETELSKIKDGDTFWHRMGDVGYLDEKGRLWFCGRKAHRVQTAEATLYTIPCEAIINEHPEVYRSALVGVDLQQAGVHGKIPVLIVEPKKESTLSSQKLLQQVKEIGAASPLTSQINHYLVHPAFPVDIRHNAKIFREKLALWARDQI